MQRIDTAEILDSDACPPVEVEASLRDLCRINRWFGGVATTRNLIERVASATGKNHFSVLEVAAGFGEVPEIAAAATRAERESRWTSPTSIACRHTCCAGTALWSPMRSRFPFATAASIWSAAACSRIIWSRELAQFAREALRVSRCAVLINDLIRHPLHLALVYAGFPLMRSYVSRLDGVASVRRAYVPDEDAGFSSSRLEPDARVEISRHFLFRMGVIAWKKRMVEVRLRRDSASGSFDSRGPFPASISQQFQRTTSTSLTLSRARKNLMEAKSRKRVSMWRLLKTRCRRKPSVIAV